MLKDITLGQFFPGNTIVHRLDPRTKILAVILYIVALFSADSVLTYVLAAAVLALAAWKFIGKNGDSINYERPQTKVTYQVKVEGVAPELYENCQAHLPSPLMASGALVGGQIEAVEKETYQVLDANGNWVTDPDHVTLIFTVTTTTPTAEVMTTKVGDQEVRIGKTDYILKSEYIEFSDGTITNVIWGD